MAWLPAPENITTGWSPGQRYEAPNIGPLVGDILRNRLAQQINQQNQMKNLADTIQQQRASQAFAQQAGAAGLLPGVDTSALGGVDPKSVATLAQLIQEQTPDTDLDALHRAMANYYSTGGRGGGGGAGASYETVIGPDGLPHRVTGNAALRSAQAGGPNPYYDRFNMVTTPGVVTYWNQDYSKQLSAQEAEADPNTIAVLPDGTPMPYGTYKKMAGIIVNKYYTNPRGPSDVNDSDTDNPLPAGPSAPPPASVGPTPPTTAPGPAPPPAQVGPSAPPSANVSPTPPYDQSIPSASPSPTPRIPPNASQGAPVNLPIYMKAPDGTISTVDPNLVEYYKSKGAVIVQGP